MKPGEPPFPGSTRATLIAVMVYYVVTNPGTDSPMSTQRAVEMQFPCAFPIKAMGHAHADFEARVLEIVRQHAPGFADDAVQRRPSVGGKYLSITVTIEAQSREQLDAIYRELSACEQVLVAL